MTSLKKKIDHLISDKAVSLIINGEYYSISEAPCYTTLNTFIRDHAELKGTKIMCNEGGCGACVVTVTEQHPVTGVDRTFAVNSCLVPVYLCHGWSIVTVEDLGNRYDGYNEIQARLASNNGSQCGYCSPGMVMNMHSLLQRNSGGNNQLTMNDIEDSFGGHICRCTGYRPILDAFKSFGSDAPVSVKKCFNDKLKISAKPFKTISSESVENKHTLVNQENYRSEFLELSCSAASVKIVAQGDSQWYRVTSVKEIFEIFDQIGENTYMIIHGNTAQGVYHTNKCPTVYIDVRGVADLHSYEVAGDAVFLGGNVSLNDAITYFNDISQNYSTNFGYTSGLAKHMKMVANVAVRNIGSLAGNLSLKHHHRNFPSDLFVIFETVGAELVIEDSMGQSRSVCLTDYLEIDMNKKVITKIAFPVWNNSEYIFKSYKVMRSAQNSLVYVNAGFLFKVDKSDGYRVLERPSIVFGGISSNFVHAVNTEDFAVGKRLLNQIELTTILVALTRELNPDYILPDASPEYRKGLALSLFYKFVLSLSPGTIDPKLRSGGDVLLRPLSSGQQSYETQENIYPVSEPLQKLDALCQCSGEAVYVNDMPSMHNEVYGAVVIATVAKASSFTIDKNEVLGMKGVIAFYTAEDIPGNNTFMTSNLYPYEDELVFANEGVSYAGQPLGVVIAETEDEARLAAKKVKVEYSGLSQPVVDFIDVITSNDSSRITEAATIKPVMMKPNTRNVVFGKFKLRSQYHYTMETQSCYCVPVEDGMHVYATTQWPTLIQETISNVLNIKQDSIDVVVKRVGGAYGAKLTRNSHVAAICAIGAQLTARPVRLVLDMETNMAMIGKRFSCYARYEAGVDGNGVIQFLIASVYQDAGLVPNDLSLNATLTEMKSIYDVSSWSVTGYVVKTDTPTNTWCRAPNSTEGIATIENIMEHIAKVINKDPVAVKLANVNPNGDNSIVTMINDLITTSDYRNRLNAVNMFNQKNRWKKRGIALMPMIFVPLYPLMPHALVSIFGIDGTVAISHGGVEMGQGINTKAAQICAYTLGIPITDVTVKATENIISANDDSTGGSLTSEAVANGVEEACNILLERLQPVRDAMPDASWREVIRQAYFLNINLNCLYRRTEPLQTYNIPGVAVTEVEIDILTGQSQVIRVDLLEDVGLSLNPYIDIGQVEGAFVMGLGYYTSEQLIYDKTTGKLLTDRSWNYSPPGAKDIPVDFRIQFLQNSYNSVGVHGSKATGEPPLVLSGSVLFAIRNAVQSARNDAGLPDIWFTLDGPATCENIWLRGLTNISQFRI